MRPRLAKLGAMEWVFIGALLFLIAAEAGAFLVGLGAFFTVVNVGYLLALATAFLLYQHDRRSAKAKAGLVLASAPARPRSHPG